VRTEYLQESQLRHALWWLIGTSLAIVVPTAIAGIDVFEQETHGTGGIATILTMMGIFLISDRVGKRTTAYLGTVLPSIVIAILATGTNVALMASQHPGRNFLLSQLHRVAGGMLLGAAIMFSLESIVHTLGMLVHSAIRRIQTRRHPHLVSFLLLQQLQEWVCGPLSGFESLEQRRTHILMLEELARIFEGGFIFRYGSVGSDSSQPFILVGSYFRELCIWIASPQSGTRQCLQQTFADSLNAIASGNYHYLPRADAVVKPSRITVARRTLAICRTALIGALPLAALLVVQRTSKLSGEVGTTFLIGALAWLCVTYINALDPQSAANLASTRDLLGAFGSRKQD